MIPLSFGIRPAGLLQNRCDFLSVQIAHGWPVHLLYRDACNLSALRDRQWLAMCDKGEEAEDGSQTTVAGADGYFPVILQVLQEREHFSGVQVGQRQGGDLSTLALGDEEQPQL